MSNYLIEIIVVMILLEIFEASWQRAESVEGILANSYFYYQKSIFIFFLMHPTFYFILFVSLYTSVLNLGIISILIFKALDLLFKLDIINKHFINHNLDIELTNMIKSKVEPWVFLMGLFMYVPILLLSLI